MWDDLKLLLPQLVKYLKPQTCPKCGGKGFIQKGKPKKGKVPIRYQCRYCEGTGSIIVTRKNPR